MCSAHVHGTCCGRHETLSLGFCVIAQLEGQCLAGSWDNSWGVGTEVSLFVRSESFAVILGQ